MDKEKHLPPVARVISIAWWALHKLQRYTTFAKGGTTVMVADKDILEVLHMGKVHQSIIAYLLDVDIYHVVW